MLSLITYRGLASTDEKLKEGKKQITLNLFKLMDILIFKLSKHLLKKQK